MFHALEPRGARDTFVGHVVFPNHYHHPMHTTRLHRCTGGAAPGACTKGTFFLSAPIPTARFSAMMRPSRLPSSLSLLLRGLLPTTTTSARRGGGGCRPGLPVHSAAARGFASLVRLDVQDHVAVITLDNPAKLNPLTVRPFQPNPNPPPTHPPTPPLSPPPTKKRRSSGINSRAWSRRFGKTQRATSAAWF